VVSDGQRSRLARVRKSRAERPQQGPEWRGRPGYKGNWLRTDFTVDHTGIDYRGAIASPGGHDGPAFSTLTSISAPGTASHLTSERIETSEYISRQAPPFTPRLSNTQWRFAWGTAINLSPSFAVDVGYRYLDLGDASTATDAFGQITLKNIAAHEARVSVGVSSDVAIH
jgi:opacity protein-like surface antigen